MKTKLGIRIISSVLALELALSPVAMARAAFPAQDLQPETPVGEEITLAQEENNTRETLSGDSTELIPGKKVNFYRVAANVKTNWRQGLEDDEGMPLYPFSLDSILGRLDVEMAREWQYGGPYALWNPRVWGYAARGLGTGYVLDDEGHTASTYAAVPVTDWMGRVPDMVFDNYYIGDRVLGTDGKETLIPKETVDEQVYDYIMLWDYQNTVVDELLNYYSEDFPLNVYRLDGTYDRGTESNAPLVIDAKWKPSPNAQVTALAMDVHGTKNLTTSVTEVYTQDPLDPEVETAATMPLSTNQAGLGAQPVDKKSGADLPNHEMWLWVGKDQTSLDLHFQTYEPYIDYTRDFNRDPNYAGGEHSYLVKEYETPPVQVSYAFDGAEEATPYDLTKGDNLECFYTPKAIQAEKNYAYTAQNTPEDPARGQWTVKNIPLTETREDGTAPETVTITLTVTAPDGENTQEYKVHVQRRKSPTGSMSYGNTPVGMIQRCDDNYWDSTGKATKEEALEAFKSTHDFQNTTVRPGGNQNQLGQIYLGTYHTTAWSEYGSDSSNVDLDENAVVAYLDSAFEDPGVSFTDSVGRPVIFDPDQGTVTRTIKLKRPAGDAPLSPDQFTSTLGVEDCWYSCAEGRSSLSQNEVSQTLQTGNDLVDLRGLKVLPGVYEMVYTYEDALTSATDTDRDDYICRLTRKLVILPIPGDVDMDGAVTVADANALREHLTAWNGNHISSILRLMKYRVFNLNGDNVVDQDDVNMILKGYQPLVHNGDHSDYFYLPLPGEQQLARKTWDEVTQATGSGELSLEFLGVEKGTRSGEYTQDPTGPWDTKTYQDEGGVSRLTPVALPKVVDGRTVEDDSVFWMAVNLSGLPADGSEDFVDQFSFSLIYDSTYVEPASIYTSADKTGHEDTFDGWSYTMRKYNLRETEGQAGRTIWTGKSNCYSITASDSARPFQTHYTKVISQLESDQPTGQASTLKELVFTMEHLTDADYATWRNGTILVVPFRLKVNPAGKNFDLARLIEIGPGMRDFTLVTSHTSALATFFGVTRSANMESTTAAFSAQDDIFGGSTHNLREDIQNAIQTDAKDGMVPIGADNTVRKVLLAGTYGEEYVVTNVGNGNREPEQSGLPPGLSYNSGNKQITGIPTQPGDYEFTLNMIPYSIHIAPKTLHYRPVNATTFYGETEYRGAWNDEGRTSNEKNRDFTFEYNAKDLSAGDRLWLETEENVTFAHGTGEDEPDEWRPGTELQGLLTRTVANGKSGASTTYTYTPPAFAAYTSTDFEDEHLVRQDTPVSDTATYTINVQRKPYSTTYDMVEYSTAELKIAKRPVFIDYVVARPAKIGIFTDGSRGFQNLNLEEGANTAGGSNIIALCHTGNDYGDMPLTGDAKLPGDRLAATILNGEFLFNNEEKAANKFILHSREEERSLKITNIALRNAEGFDSQNYKLEDNLVHRADYNDVTGLVRMKRLVSMSIAAVPSYFEKEHINTYGDRMEVLDGLKIAIKQEGDPDNVAPTAYDYDKSLPLELGVHYNWVTPEEYAEGVKEENKSSYIGSGYDPTKEEGERNTRPYSQDVTVAFEGNWLYPYMDGWRLCACVLQPSEDGAEDTYLKAYSEPIHIQKKQITITPDIISRYYGEKLTQEELTYTFSLSDLAGRDVKTSYNSGTPDVLKDVMAAEEDFKDFTIKTVNLAEEEIDETAPVTAVSSYRVLISGGESSRYTFRFSRVDAAGKVIGTDPVKGWAPLNVKARPLVVQAITGNNEDGTFGDIYADTKNLTTTGLVADLDHVTFAPPPVNEKGNYAYYTENSANDTYIDAGTYNEDPVVEGEDLKVEYQLTFLPDAGHFSWTNFTTNFFENTQFDDSEAGMVKKPVQAHKLVLTGEDKSNYKLVYADSYSAGYRTPADAAKPENQKKAPEFNGPGEINKQEVTYLTSGYGWVHLRPIVDLELADLGQMNYTYGEGFAPGQPGTGKGSEGLTVRVKYATQYDNWPSTETYPDRNITQEDVVYYDQRFHQRGFTIYYYFHDPDQTPEEQRASQEQAVEAGQILDAGSTMVPALHDGAAIFVTGRRSERDDMIYGHPERPVDHPEIVNALQVSKGVLTLRAQDGHKLYGEDNPTFTYLFDTSDLAEVDQDQLKKLAAEGAVTLPADHEEGAPALLEALDPTGCAALQFTYRTDANAASPVFDPAGERAYPVTMEVTGELSNYTVKTEDCNLYIYPRPVSVTGIVSSIEHPAYTIFTDTVQQSFKTNLNTQAQAGSYVTVGCGSQTVTYATTLIDGSVADLPITISKGGLVNDDSLTFAVTVEYPTDWQHHLEDGTTDVDKVPDTIAYVTGMVADDVSRNYDLNDMGTNYDVVGAAKLRTIIAIHIKGRPQKMDYTYQESLNLTGLQVQVDFARINSQEVVESKTFDYIGEDQFQAAGLYVNYWGEDDRVPNELKALPGRYRVARNGDHLTIAPTHDTQGMEENGNTAHNGYRFAANGKYLIISAFQAGADQSAAQPVVLGEMFSDSGYWEDTPIPITVKPLRLRYNLTATDKTYDGTTVTAGSLELTNLFQKAGKVDEYHPDGLTDVVYIPVGADYETGSDNHHDYRELKDMTHSGHVTFTTGSYTANGEAPLLENGRITWKYPNYTWGEDLTFSFANENVHYVDDLGVSGVGNTEKATYWRTTQTPNTVTGRWDTFPNVTAMPVEVTNIDLYGPDAANYTWGETDGTHVTKTEVKMETRAQTENGQAATPFATIHKANRSLIQTSSPAYPTVQVDIHTNVVRLFFRDDLLREIAGGWNNNNVAGTEDPFLDELHFEYALAYQDENGLYRQWAGKNGDKDYQDTTFFGGETVAPAIAQGYTPDVSRRPLPEDADEKTVYKGQRYGWLSADTGVSTKGYREDGGFWVNGDAYPGGADYVDAFWEYTLYATDRKNLPRNTVFYPLVRLAETHNYNPSGDLTGTGDTSISAATLDAARKAVAALDADPDNETLLAEAQTKSAAVFEEGKAMADAAKADAQKKVDDDYALGESRQYPKEPPATFNWPANVAVKTFTQRMDILSTEELRDAVDASAKYMVETLEAVWFTDTLIYEKEQFLSAVLYNDPIRYYNYYWDKDLSALLKFNEGALNFTEEITDIRIRERQPDRSTVEKYITVNQFDPALGGRVAKIYAQVVPNDNMKPRSIKILPRALFARLGDPTYQLQLVTVPERPSVRDYTWTTSNPAVATVDQLGVVTFRGVGVCTISVVTHNNKKDAITVTVLPALPALTNAESLFDHYFASRPWMGVDYRGAFRPHDVMTRAQVVLLLDQFLRPSKSWQATTELPYLDVTGKETYADALRRLTGAGVVTGVPGSAFVGEQPITRAELAAMLARMLRLDVPDTKGMVHLFQDSAEEDTWAYAYIDAVGQTGIMRGVGGGNFAPSRLITREEVAAVIARMLTVQLPDTQKELTVPTDMTPENWSYESVLRAINAVIFPD